MADGITKIAVEGFKSIAKRQEIEIAPLTILAGANSSGKSSIMQPLLLLKQTLEATYDPGPLKIDGPNVMFTSSEQFLSLTDQRSTDQLTIEISTLEEDFTISFRRGEAGIEVLEQVMAMAGLTITLRPDMSNEAVGRIAVEQIGVKPDEFRLVRNRFFLDIQDSSSRQYRLLPSFEEQFVGLIHVPGLRGSRSRAYRVTAPGPRFPGTFDEYVATVILYWQKQDPQGYEDFLDDLRLTGLARMVLAHQISDVAIELRVSLEDYARTDNIADVGFGVSQVLPVLVALRAAGEGGLVYLEEPEIDLHPRAQTKLAEVLAAAAERGVRVVAETHSTLLLTAIRPWWRKASSSQNSSSFTGSSETRRLASRWCPAPIWMRTVPSETGRRTSIQSPLTPKVLTWTRSRVARLVSAEAGVQRTSH
jgi:predicted ATPase